MATTTKINGVWHTSNNIGGGSQGEHPYLSLERLCPYLYKVTFDAIPQDNGNNAPVGGGCSSYVRNGKLYRNFDFKYDNAASFIVRTKDFEGMAMLTGLNDGQMDDALIAQLPYRMVDGRNNEGIMVSVHLLFNDWEYTGAGQKSIPMTRLPFEVLSRVKSMATIGTDLADVLGNLSVGEAMGDYLLQVLVTDGTTTYAVIPPTSDNQSYELVNATSYPKMSNFRYVARAEVSRYDMDLQTRPTGIERFNAMPCPLEDLRFTLAYEEPDRLSEFIGIDGTTKDSSDAELEAIYELARAEYLVRQRDGVTWQTMHSVVYGEKMEALFIQEDWSRNLVSAGTAAIIYGYLFEGVFYEESTHTTAINPSSANQYVDMTDATAPVPYIWNGSGYVLLGEVSKQDLIDDEKSLAYAILKLYEDTESSKSNLTKAIEDDERVIAQALYEHEQKLNNLTQIVASL